LETLHAAIARVIDRLSEPDLKSDEREGLQKELSILLELRETIKADSDSGRADSNSASAARH
jgi:hypothetical protein